ncbi:SRPBCC family protein [Arenibaculum sp.]|uniref:SRPBCC family protein n=1 Tax=Arenibaculum sp. TaxID=2865862 RepID=UPI002E160538|nr:SRPBCC family protein [Arenibaculum sp.]
MTDRIVVHGTVTLDRFYRATPARVFAAWSDPKALLRWGSPGEGWHVAYERFDFQVGGGDRCRFGPEGGETYVTENRYEDIVQDTRIVSSSVMTAGGRRSFIGLVTVDLRPERGGCRLVFTEQGAYLDGLDRPEGHEAGWTEMLDKLTLEVEPAGGGA